MPDGTNGNALEELLASDTPATAKVWAASELLDRLEPLLAKKQMDVRRELAEEMEAATASARAKLTAMLDRQARVASLFG